MKRLTSKYHIAESIGQGGMGEVFCGQMTGIEGFSRTVAVKMLRSFYTEHEACRALFAHEARICAQLQHRNVIAVLDFERSDKAEPFLVMEYIDGVDLRALAESAPLSIDTVVFIVTEVLRALAHVHRRGVIHRDVKPRNVLLSRSGEVKLTDFGMARLRDHSSIQLTSGKKSIKGTVGYLAPEIIKQVQLDHRVDQFTIGVMLYELLTGTMPFGKDRLDATIARVFSGPPEPPESLNADVSGPLSAVVMRLLRIDPAERYADAQEARRALIACANIAHGAGVLTGLMAQETKAPPVADPPCRQDPGATEYFGPPPGHNQAPSSPKPQARKSYHVLIVAMLALASLLGGLGYRHATGTSQTAEHHRAAPADDSADVVRLPSEDEPAPRRPTHEPTSSRISSTPTTPTADKSTATPTASPRPTRRESPQRKNPPQIGTSSRAVTATKPASQPVFSHGTRMGATRP